jgi:peptidoglycan/xylan/chitin deacetylase (PgdA/CDA1 family)
MIAITIDDDFSQSAVLADLAILEANHVNATFFPIGHVVASNPGLWQKVAKAGFPIANHTYDHVILTKHTLAYITADIEKDNAVVSKIIGEPLAPFIRPPGGAWNGDVLTAAAAAGERAVVLWDLTDGDTAPLPGRANVSLLVKNATKGVNGSILLMHANLPYAQQALPLEIAYYRAKGYEFVTLGQMFGVKGPVPFPSGKSYPSSPLPSPKPNPKPSPSSTPSSALTPEPSLTPRPTLSPIPTC